MRAEMNVLAAIFVDKRLSISGQKDAERIRHQQDARGHSTGETEKPFLQAGDVGMAEVHMLHQVMQRDVCVVSAHAQERGRTQAEERSYGMVRRSVRRKNKIEPDDIGLDPADLAPNLDGIT